MKRALKKRSLISYKEEIINTISQEIMQAEDYNCLNEMTRLINGSGYYCNKCQKYNEFVNTQDLSENYICYTCRMN